VKSEDYIGNIMPSWQYAAMNTSSQMNKAIPVLLEIGDDLKAAKGNTDAIPQILEEIKGVRDELQPGFAMQFRQMQADVRAVNYHVMKGMACDYRLACRVWPVDSRLARS